MGKITCVLKREVPKKRTHIAIPLRVSVKTRANDIKFERHILFANLTLTINYYFQSCQKFYDTHAPHAHTQNTSIVLHLCHFPIE